MTYDELLVESDEAGLDTRELPLIAYDGRIKGRRIAIRASIPTMKQKGCVLAEELGHYHTSCGDILQQRSGADRLQEMRARRWGFDHMIGLDGILRAYEARCRSAYEMAELLDVTEDYLKEALDYYRGRYGTSPVRYRSYLIYFSPLAVIKLLND